MAQQEKPIIPPPRKPVQEFFTPTPAAVFYTELVNRDDPAYQAVSPIMRGSPYNSILGGRQEVTDKYPSLYFLRESRFGTSDQLVLWTWANDPVAESSYNSEVSYFLEDVSTPTFTRVYTVRRDMYDNSTPTARGTALSAIIGVKITAAGEDYTFATGVIGNATVVFVCGNGQILSGIVTKEGSGITNNATIAIQGDGGNGAAKTIVQPATATLISEGKKEFPENHPLRNEYVQVVRVYRNPTGPILTEQQYDQTWDVVVPSTWQEVAVGSAGVGTNRRDIRKIDTVRSEVTTFDPTVLNAVFGTYLNYFPNTTNLQLPDVLTSLTSVENSSSASGTYDEAATGVGSGSDWFMSMSEHGRGQASASIMFDVLVEYKQYWARNIPMTSYFFFLQSPVTSTQVLAKLQTLTGLTIGAWPKFVPQAHTIVALGQKVGVGGTAKAGFQQSASSSGSSASDTGGIGSDFDVSTSRHAIRIPPMIHGAINITGITSSFVTASATATAVDIINNMSVSPSLNAIGGLTPTGFGATSPASIVLSGLLLLRSDVSPYRFGWAKVSADVVNMGDVA